MAEREYHFTTEPDGDEVRLRWSSKGPDTRYWDPLDFWIVAADYVEQAKDRVCAGEFDSTYKWTVTFGKSTINPKLT